MFSASSGAFLLMHLLLTIIRHAVSHPAIRTDDSMPCGHCA